MNARGWVVVAALLALGGLLSGCAGTRAAPATLEAASRLVDPAEGRAIPLRLAYPVRGRDLPVVLFSHGAFSSGDDYDPIVDAWAARGYVVISPTHRDSVSLGVKRGAGDPRHFGWRLDDMGLILARLPEVLAGVPGLAERTDTTRIAATGHSFGGLVAQTLGGATYFDAASGQELSRADPRIGAVIVFSGAGVFPPMLRPEDFARLRAPTLVTVGTEDLRQAPGLSGYAWRKQPYDFAPGGDHYLLTLDGADHYLGGIVGRDDLPKHPQAPQFLAAFNETSGRFLDAWLRNDPSARQWLVDRSGTAPRAAMPALSRLESKRDADRARR